MSCDSLFEALAGYIETDRFGTVTYYNHLGVKHRTDGPAVIYENGRCIWYIYGKALSEKEFLQHVATVMNDES